MNRKIPIGYPTLFILLLTALLAGACGGALVGGAAGYGLAWVQHRWSGSLPGGSPALPTDRGPWPNQARQPYLGVRYEQLTPDRAAELGLGISEGALVLEVDADSPAQRADIRPGDVIVAVDGQAVTLAHPLAEHVRRLSIGKTAQFTVVRGGQEFVVSVLIGSRTALPLEFPPDLYTPPGSEGRPQQPRPRDNTPFLGVRYEPLSPALAQSEGLDITDGALIREVLPGSPAEQAGLRPGDVIIAVNDTSVDASHDLADLILSREVGETVRLKVWRAGRVLDIRVVLGRVSPE